MDRTVQPLDQALFSEFFHRPVQNGSQFEFGIKNRQPDTYEDFFREVKKHCKSSVISITRSKKFNEAVKVCYQQIFKVSNSNNNV